jgi:formylglycine-generating enzyme required for sulfatase activity
MIKKLAYFLLITFSLGADSMNKIDFEEYDIKAVSGCSPIAKSRADNDCDLKSLPKSLRFPEMITIPGGEFQMGSQKGDEDEKPVRNVSIKAFKMSRTEITFFHWDTCVSDGGCKYSPDDKGWGRGKRPVINVSYEHVVEQYLPWLNQVTGQKFRLPSEAEWEYAARSGSSKAFPWGELASHEYANYGKNDCCSGLAKGKDKWIYTSPVKSFPANKFGLFDMHGNVWEWVQDCWNDSYERAPIDGSAWMSGDCSSRVLRSGGWKYHPHFQRSANRSWFSTSHKGDGAGFRLAHDIIDEHAE